MSFVSVSSLLSGPNGDPRGAPDLEEHLDGEDVLVPLLVSEASAVTDQLRVAASLARTTGGSLTAVDPVAVSGRTPVEQCREPTPENESALIEWAVERVSNASSGTDARFACARGFVDDVSAAAATADVDALVVPGDRAGGLLRGSFAERLAQAVDCDVVTVNGPSGYEGVPSILLAVSGGPHSGVATDVARRVAADCDAWVDVLRVVEENASERERREAEELVESAYRRLDRPESTSKWILEAEDATEAIVEQSAYYGLTVIGAPTKGRLRRFVSGSTSRTVRDNAESVVLSAHTRREPKAPGGD
ncbi:MULTISPECIES: universal stress protein [Halorussus]|uniref:universal stress protein n=1 Tax=Halorussus TaxID=1070314 RepID=UPI00209DB1DA|nr:universal stress protein [Halorussus vallis]USZ76752.1 universal stress protein [Halorussus vallis]